MFHISGLWKVTYLEGLNCHHESRGFEISHDDNVIVGKALDPQTQQERPFIYTDKNKMSALGLLKGRVYGSAVAVSGDGKIVAGWERGWSCQ